MLKTVYLYDVNGYFNGTRQTHPDPVKKAEGKIEYMMPRRSTEEVPQITPDKFAKWDGKKWIYEAKPTKAEHFVGKLISHKPKSAYEVEMLALMQAAVQAEAETYRAELNQKDMVWSVSLIPEPTKEEKLEEAKQKLFAEMDALDLKSVRAARAVALAVSQGKTPDQADVNKLAEIEQEMKALRTKAFVVK